MYIVNLRKVAWWILFAKANEIKGSKLNTDTTDGDVMIVTNSDGEELKFTRIREYLTSESETDIMR